MDEIIRKKVGAKLKEARKDNKYSLEDVQLILKNKLNIDLDISNISRYESGTVKNMNAKFLRGICKANNIDYVPLFKQLGFVDEDIEEVIHEKSNAKILIDDTLINIPVMAKASAGNGYLNFSNQPLYNKLIRKNGFHEHCYLIEVAGNSMEPLIQDGAYVVVDPYQTDYIEGKIYVIKYEDEIYIKRVILKSDANLMILKSINPDYEDIYITGEEAEQIKIIGRAVKFIYEGNL